MPVIPRLKDKKRPPTARAKERHKAYADKIYRDIRAWYMKTHPLCELCQKDGIVEAAKECHHIKSPFDTNISETEKLNRLRDDTNLMALCNYHHRLQHHTTSPKEDEEYKLKLNNKLDIY